MARKPYPSDVLDNEWQFVAPHLTLMSRRWQTDGSGGGGPGAAHTGQPWGLNPIGHWGLHHDEELGVSVV